MIGVIGPAQQVVNGQPELRVGLPGIGGSDARVPSAPIPETSKGARRARRVAALVKKRFSERGLREGSSLAQLQLEE